MLLFRYNYYSRAKRFFKICPGPIKFPAWNIFKKLINVLSLIRASWQQQMLKINKIVLDYYSELKSTYTTQLLRYIKGIPVFAKLCHLLDQNQILAGQKYQNGIQKWRSKKFRLSKFFLGGQKSRWHQHKWDFIPSKLSFIFFFKKKGQVLLQRIAIKLCEILICLCKGTST